MKKFLAVVWTVLISMTTVAQTEYNVDSVLVYREKMNAVFADKEQSPLMKEDLAGFGGLDFFPPDAKYFVVARLVRSENEKPFKMKTSTSRKPLYQKYGELHFTIDGKPLKLNVYKNMELGNMPAYRDHLFLPFSDLTSGKETYIGGRYIDLSETAEDTMVIDFNKAYNPYCAYNHAYSCPIVPLENDLPVEIRAGVKSFHD